ncbi:hypothetical protein MMC17_008159 [Xylographa soralifera]|nr:hypothetical protein [Xylographa soralifera]
MHSNFHHHSLSLQSYPARTGADAVDKLILKMTLKSANSDEGDGSGCNGDIDMGSGDEQEAENQSALGSINDENELGEETGKEDGKKGEWTRGEEDSDEDFLSEWQEEMPLEDEGIGGGGGDFPGFGGGRRVRARAGR